jgi:hypothetical protein
MSTCLDVNKSASAANTAALQTKKSQISLSTSAGGGTLNAANSANNLSTQILSARSELANSRGDTFSTSTTNLSLIVAAGFNKGEIHVFDLFKNEASAFYNNSVTKFSLCNSSSRCIVKLIHFVVLEIGRQI